MAYHAVGKKLFGLQHWKPDNSVYITESDENLLDKLVFVNPISLIKRRETQKDPGKMPPGTVPNPTKKKVRPSSAAANLRTDDIYKTSLYDDARPSTAAFSTGQTPTQRPKTHAGGPRYWNKGKETLDKHSASTDNIQGQRRNTVGTTEGIGDKQKLGKPKLNQQSIGKALKAKVRLCLVVISLL